MKSHRPAAPSPPGQRTAKRPAGRRKENVLVDVTRRGGSGGWTAGGSDEDRCRLTPSTPTEFVFHRAFAEAAWAAHHTRTHEPHTRHTGAHTTKTETTRIIDPLPRPRSAGPSGVAAGLVCKHSRSGPRRPRPHDGDAAERPAGHRDLTDPNPQTERCGQGLAGAAPHRPPSPCWTWPPVGQAWTRGRTGRPSGGQQG